ncbi:polyprenyl synthetase family protein [Bordetella flabilis]|uniref:Geranyl transferase n=1 Tax=Bordetella flabilis TaxID=463014 RepID=A0A193GBK7_9BORD|nr:farnesyl diphosphate synthase [Bordetella flabilis]ANN77210.1 geranyl transferase [Bordetella flabilis]
MKHSHLAFPEWLAGRAEHVERTLDELLPAADVVPARLHEAMRYAVLGGGKRVRAALVYAAGQACVAGGHPIAIEASLDRAAAAVELIHAYSLVHDDLPCMDDDTLRRGRPTVHVQYDEATAMLVGDALQPLAFELLADMPIAPALVVQATQALARASGSLGMAGGQAIDLESVGRSLNREELQSMHGMKTGAMLAVSVALGGIVSGASSSARQALDDYAQAMGLAFQVVDDILDVTADTRSLGKTAGKDAADNKPTYVSLLGLEQARSFAQALREAALQALAPLGEGRTRLAELADFIVLRDR